MTKWDKYREIQEGCFDLAIAKNADYGNDSIGGTGVLGISVRLWDKMCRLKNLVIDKKEAQIKTETIDDIFMDMINYATYALILLREPDAWYR